MDVAHAIHECALCVVPRGIRHSPRLGFGEQQRVLITNQLGHLPTTLKLKLTSHLNSRLPRILHTLCAQSAQHLVPRRTTIQLYEAL